MAAPSWTGETIVGRCTECGHLFEAPSINADRGPRSGFCRGCDGHTTFEYWDGPVAVVES